MRAFCQRHAGLLAAFALATPLLSVSAQEPTQEPAADPQEVAALAALRALEAALPAIPAAADEDALRTWAETRRAAYSLFVNEHPGRLAAAEAWHALGQLRLQFDATPDAGLDAMTAAWVLLRDFEGVQPEGLLLPRAGYEEALLAQLLDVDALDRAAALLEELRAAAGDDPRRLQRLQRDTSHLAALRRLRPGQAFPGFRAVALDGSGPRGPEDFRGAPLLLEFQAAWVGPSRSSLPRRVAQAEGWIPRGLQLLTVYLDPDVETSRALVDVHAPSWPQVWLEGGLQGATAQSLALRSLPRRFLLDADGVIVARDLDGAGLERAVEALLGPPPAPQD